MSCWHKWGKWKRIVVTVYYGAKRDIDEQERECQRCGLVQRKGMS